MSYMAVGRDLGQTRGLFAMPSSTFLLEVSLQWAGRETTAPSPDGLPKGKQIGLPKDIPCVLAVSGVDRDETAFQQRRSLFWERVRFFSDHPQADPLPSPIFAHFQRVIPSGT